MEGEIVWFLFVQGILASITVIGYGEHDQDGGSMITFSSTKFLLRAYSYPSTMMKRS